MRWPGWPEGLSGSAVAGQPGVCRTSAAGRASRRGWFSCMYREIHPKGLRLERTRLRQPLPRCCRATRCRAARCRRTGRRRECCRGPDVGGARVRAVWRLIPQHLHRHEPLCRYPCGSPAGPRDPGRPPTGRVRACNGSRKRYRRRFPAIRRHRYIRYLSPGSFNVLIAGSGGRDRAAVGYEARRVVALSSSSDPRIYP